MTKKKKPGDKRVSVHAPRIVHMHTGQDCYITGSLDVVILGVKHVYLDKHRITVLSNHDGVVELEILTSFEVEGK